MKHFERIQNAIYFIEAHLDRTFSLADVSKRSGIIFTDIGFR